MTTILRDHPDFSISILKIDSLINPPSTGLGTSEMDIGSIFRALTEPRNRMLLAAIPDYEVEIYKYVEDLTSTTI